MTPVPAPTIRMRLDVLNPGQFLACCGLLELADRLWGGAHGWFEDASDSFCAAPIEPDPRRDYGARALLEALKAARLSNVDMSEAEMKRLEALAVAAKKAKQRRGKSRGAGDSAARDIPAEKDGLDARWSAAKDGALSLGHPFEIRLDWFLDGRSGGGRFKTWAGQQNITDIALGLKSAVDQGTFDAAEDDWLFARQPCETALHLDALPPGSALDVGFSFDPLQIGSPEKRPLVELLAFIGLQRVLPRQLGERRAFAYSLWSDPLPPQVAHAAARGFGAGVTRTLEFRLLFRSKYLKSFLPAQARRTHR